MCDLTESLLNIHIFQNVNKKLINFQAFKSRSIVWAEIRLFSSIRVYSFPTLADGLTSFLSVCQFIYLYFIYFLKKGILIIHIYIPLYIFK